MAPKSSTERQLRYQERRQANERRIAVWLSHDLIESMDHLRGEEARADFMRRAVEREILERMARVLRPVADEAAKG